MESCCCRRRTAPPVALGGRRRVIARTRVIRQQPQEVRGCRLALYSHPEAAQIPLSNQYICTGSSSLSRPAPPQ